MVLRISGIAVESSIAIPETASLSSLQFCISHNTSEYCHSRSSPQHRWGCRYDQL